MPELADLYWCPCGHDMHGEYMCINGLIFGPCPEPTCGGVCETNGSSCTSDECRCADL